MCAAAPQSTPGRQRQTRFTGTLDNGYSNSIRRHRAASRATQRIEPEAGEVITILGIVDQVSHVSAFEKLGVNPGTLDAEQIVKKFSGENVTQITVRVDDLDKDAEALDYKSYTLWISGDFPEVPQRGEVIIVSIYTDALLRANGIGWIADEFDFLM